MQARQRKKIVTAAILQGLGSVCTEDRKGGKKENLWTIKAVALVRCHCASNFKNPFGNHGSCIAVITETLASPTYYCKHSNSCHVSKRSATQTVETVLQGGADWSRGWGTAQCHLYGFNEAGCSLWSLCRALSDISGEKKQPQKTAFWIKSYIGGTQAEAKAEYCFDVHEGGPVARIPLHLQEWSPHRMFALRKWVHLLPSQYVIPSNWKWRSLSPFT